MVNEDTILDVLGHPGNVKKFGADYDFQEPIAFIQTNGERVAGQFAEKIELTVWLVYSEEGQKEGLMSLFDGKLQKGFFQDYLYIYAVGKSEGKTELLPNGYKQTEVTYNLLIEEVQ